MPMLLRQICFNSPNSKVSEDNLRNSNCASIIHKQTHQNPIWSSSLIFMEDKSYGVFFSFIEPLIYSSQKQWCHCIHEWTYKKWIPPSADIFYHRFLMLIHIVWFKNCQTVRHIAQKDPYYHSHAPSHPAGRTIKTVKKSFCQGTQSNSHVSRRSIDQAR